MECSLSSLLGRIPSYFADFKLSRYSLFFLAIDVASLTLCCKFPFIQLLTSIPVLLYIDKFKLFINLYFPEGATIRIDQSHFDELILVKVPTLLICFASCLRSAAAICSDVRRTSRMVVVGDGGKKLE